MIEKPKRKRNTILISYLGARLECAACTSSPPSDMDHITTRGAGGDDSLENMMPLCRVCHQIRHKPGIVYMADHYPGYVDYMDMVDRADVIATARSRTK